MPPLLEYLESLLSGTGRALDLQTFKLVDQLSGRTLGLRADTTPKLPALMHIYSTVRVLPDFVTADLFSTQDPIVLLRPVNLCSLAQRFMAMQDSNLILK